MHHRITEHSPSDKEGSVAASVKTTTHHMTRAEARRLADECARVLIEQFGARRVIPFGSVRGDSPWHDRSDLDLAVEGLAPELETKAWGVVENLLPPNLEFDLIPLETASLTLRRRILEETKMPKDNVAGLRVEINDELLNLHHLTGEVTMGLPSLESQPDKFTVAGIAKYLHDVYSSIGRIFERIAVRLDGGLPSGDAWHKQLLDSMAVPVAGGRPAVIDAELAQQLDELRKFRHRIRHTYSYDLDWSKMKERVEQLGDVVQRLDMALRMFIQSLEASDA
jgi:predicted nucleotidyltransferase